MVKFISSAALITMVLMVSGCKDDEPNRTVEHYLNDADDRAAMLTKCEVMDNATSEANCVNAQKAAEIQTTETNNKNSSDAINSLFGSGS